MKHILIFFFFTFLMSPPIFAEAEKKSLYVSKITSTKEVPESLQKSAANKVKMAILEKYAKSYNIVSDEDVLIMYKKAAELQRICDAETCLLQIADAIDADEMIYGNLYMKGGKLTLYLNNLQRDKKTLKMWSKSVVEESFPETQFNHFVKEIAFKAIDPSYKINKTHEKLLPESFVTKSGIKFTKIFKEYGEPIYLSEVIRPNQNDSWYYARDYAENFNKIENCPDCYRLPYLEDIEYLKGSEVKEFWLQSWSLAPFGMTIGNVFLGFYTFDFLHDLVAHPLSWQSYLYPISPDSAEFHEGSWRYGGRLFRSAQMRPLGFRLVRPLRAGNTD